MAESKMHRAESFVREFAKQYFTNRDFAAVKACLDEDISWYGTGAHEICRNFKDAENLLSAEEKAWGGHYVITNQNYTVHEIDSSSWLVAGEITMYVDGYGIEMQSRGSLILVKRSGEYKVLHMHFSVPNVAQDDGEFIHKNVCVNYDKMLEEKLAERTEMLKQKTTELETLTDNICGGVLITKYNNSFTLVYASAGFTAFTGYSQEELSELDCESFYALVHKSDIDRIFSEIKEQTAKYKSFSVEYRIVHKDGHHIWVLDNGTLINRGGEECLQCILTDISAQKEQENQLRMSEKRYQTAMQMSDMVMFEYNIISKQLILNERDSKLYKVGAVVENGMETFIAQGIVHPESESDFREMYRKIHAGVPSASCFVRAKDVMGNMHEYELTMHTVFDIDGVPRSAVGVRKNISHMRMLQRESEFGKSLVRGKNYIYEANITDGNMVWMNDFYLDALDLSLNDDYITVMQRICEMVVAPKWRETVLQRTSPSYLKRKYEDGERLITFSYQRKNEIGEYHWFEATVNIMFDEAANAIMVRFYNNDINEQKEKENRAIEERRIYETMTARTALAYEVNISSNLAIKGHENWGELYGIEQTNNYSEMITSFSQRGIYAEDGPVFAASFARDRVIEEYSRGVKQLSCQYRKPNEQGSLHWVCCTLHLYEDPQTGDIKGYAYVEDIDKQKREELELKYNAEHDVMTGLLNKSAIETAVNSFLSSELLSGRQHALVMVDIDCFKNVNDTFGHLFGDDVLRDIADKIKQIFREEDLLGRIGGDEFMVFMKNVYDNEAILKKADELCRCLELEYGEKGHNASVSASVGIAVFPHHGTTYEQLNRRADVALYNAKNAGKNAYSI